MSYMVMECHPGYAILLDEEGRFLKAANLRYEVGQTVYDPVLMKEEPPKQRHPVRWISGTIAAVAACFLLFLGLSDYQDSMQPYSSIYLTINPEVQINLNRQGTVVGLIGTNEEGKLLLEGYDSRGKDKVSIADELIDRAIDMGFLSEGGQVSFSIDSPDDALFQEYGMELRTKVTEHLDGRITVTIEIVNHKNGQKEESPQSGSPPVPSQPAQTPPPSSSKPSKPVVTPPASANSTDYDDTDYGPNNDGVTDYNDTDYGPNSNGVTDYTPPAPADTDYGPNNDGATDYDDGNTNYDSANEDDANDDDDNGDDDDNDDDSDDDD